MLIAQVFPKVYIAFLPVWIGILCQTGLKILSQEPASRGVPDVAYPVAVANDGDRVYIVDLELPGIWEVSESGRDVYALGSKQLRAPLNRPRCIGVHPAGGVLVGDSATREVYHVVEKGAAPKPLTGGKIGIPMSLVVSPDLQKLYIGDAETRSVFEVPIGGGIPVSVVDINARGLAFDAMGGLWAVTPNDGAVHLIDVENRSSRAVVQGRPYQYPNGLAWVGDYGLVTDGYGKAIWMFDRDGRTELWLQGHPLLGPVGVSAHGGAVWVADPKAKQVFRLNQVDKSVQPVF